MVSPSNGYVLCLADGAIGGWVLLDAVSMCFGRVGCGSSGELYHFQCSKNDGPSSTLENKSTLPENWLHANGVLLGIPLHPIAFLTTHSNDTPSAGVGQVPHTCV